jgi:hypothetical protein
MPDLINKVATSNAYATNEKPVDMTEEMAQNYRELTPATAILTRISTARRAKNVQFDWIIEEVMPHKITYDHASESSAGTTIYSEDYAVLAIHDQLYVPRTGEVMHVDQAVTTSSIHVRRGIGDTTGAPLEAGDTIFILANAQEEGVSAIDTGRMVVNSRDYNYTQIITEMMDTTNSVDAETTYFGGPGSKRERNQFKMTYNFRTKLELAVMLNYRENYTGGTLPQRSMGGFLQWLATGPNVLDLSAGAYGGILTQSALDSFLADIKNTHPDIVSLGCFASYQFISRVNSLFKDFIRISPNAESFGLNINRYFGAMGLDLIPAPLLEGEYLGGTAFLVDFTHVDLKYLRPVVLRKNVNNSDDDDFARDRIRTEVGMRFAIPARHGMISGLAL